MFDPLVPFSSDLHTRPEGDVRASEKEDRERTKEDYREAIKERERETTLPIERKFDKRTCTTISELCCEFTDMN